MIDRQPDDGYDSDLDGDDDQCQLADRRWIDALLRRTLKPEVAGCREARIDQALAAVRRDAALQRDGHRTARSRRLWITAPAAAAVVLISLGILWALQLASPITADEAVRNAYAAALSLADREYSVRIDRAGGEDNSMSGSMYLRGEAHFAMRLDTGRFGETWFGSDGQEGWLVPGIEAFPVMVTQDLAQMYKRLEAFNIQAPFMQITTTIDTLRQHYDIELDTPAQHPGIPPLFVRVRGTRRENHAYLADRIEFLAHPQRGTIQQLTVEWNGTATQSKMRRLTLDLISEKPLADDWYQHHGHHAADRAVHDMTGQRWGGARGEGGRFPRPAPRDG